MVSFEPLELFKNFASNNLGFKVLQSNYTATGFITKKIKEAKLTKEEESEEIKIEKEEQAENKVK